jgi:rod shape-determining protein MreC
MVRGRGGDELVFEFVARGGDVQEGDVVITSGLGGVYPKGLRVGEISEVSEPGSRLLQTATLTPAVDFGRLEQVFVMLRRGPTMELLYRDAGPDAEPKQTESISGASAP